MKIMYVHGLGGSGNGSSAKNIKNYFGSSHTYILGTYDLLNPTVASLMNLQKTQTP